MPIRLSWFFHVINCKIRTRRCTDCHVAKAMSLKRTFSGTAAQATASRAVRAAAFSRSIPDCSFPEWQVEDREPEKGTLNDMAGIGSLNVRVWAESRHTGRIVQAA